ncbi:hypothetical protein NDU88_006806 [Pleurodeles waltl]|uniref:Uncharacterized protein n=1 Tax=Pleurodeles waltl TaxID=8319 RepID=A0AAV7VQW9_PLEWA|nr:hypothetical protein NDU88_006806 [Pleurodeles waltl]
MVQGGLPSVAVFREPRLGPGPRRILGQALPSSSLLYPKWPRPGSPPGPGRLLLPVLVQGPRPGPQWAQGWVLPSFNLPYPEGPRPGSPLDQARIPLSVWVQGPGGPRLGEGLRRTPMHGCVQRDPTGPLAPPVPWDGHSLPLACRTLRVPDLGVHQAWRGFLCQFGFRGPDPPALGALVCGHIAALSDGSLLQTWLPTEQTDVPEPAIAQRVVPYSGPREASRAGLGSGAPAMVGTRGTGY